MTMDAAEDVLIPESELVFKASRSSGPGGQNVNKLNTRVTALFDVAGSPSLSEEQKQQVLNALSTRVDKNGVLHVVSQKHRSQEANRRTAAERLQQLVRDALRSIPERCRKMLKMLFFEQPPRPYLEVAKELGLAEGSIGFIRGRCLEKLRKALEQRGF